MHLKSSLLINRYIAKIKLTFVSGGIDLLVKSTEMQFPIKNIAWNTIHDVFLWHRKHKSSTI